MHRKKLLLSTAIASMVLSFSAVTLAAISAEEAARLGADLTPVGAEKGANADGSIPQWNGGRTGEPVVGLDGVRPTPYAEEQPLFSISAENMGEYENKLTEVDKALLQAYPNHYKMNVYKTHRTAAWPQRIYDNIKVNALTANLINDGNGVSDVWGSIPFPVPQSGLEVIWNHMLRFQGVGRSSPNTNEIIKYNDGKTLEYSIESNIHYTFYDENASEKDKALGKWFNYVSSVTSPARDKGDGFLVLDFIDPANKPRQAWSYDPGERRVRRAPNLGFDTPDRPVNVIDDFDLFSGSPERYDFKLIGKQEKYIPYNNDRLNLRTNKRDEVYTDIVINPDLTRHELHRVWVVEATLKEGKRHVYAKRIFYVDEDTWGIVATAKYDNAGKLWRVSQHMPIVAAEVPVTAGGIYVHYDLKLGAYYSVFGVVGEKTGIVFDAKPKSAAYYSIAGMRRRGR